MEASVRDSVFWSFDSSFGSAGKRCAADRCLLQQRGGDTSEGYPSVRGRCLGGLLALVVLLESLLLFWMLRSLPANHADDRIPYAAFDGDPEGGAFAFILGPAGGWDPSQFGTIVESLKVAIYSLVRTKPLYPVVLLLVQGIEDSPAWKRCPGLAEWLLPTPSPRDPATIGMDRPFSVLRVPDIMKLLANRIRMAKETTDPKYDAFRNYSLPRDHVRKLAVFGLSTFKRVVYFDADTLILRNIDTLMKAQPTPAFAENHRGTSRPKSP